MKKQTMGIVYESPQVEVMEMMAEQCFATSLNHGNEDLDPDYGNWN